MPYRSPQTKLGTMRCPVSSTQGTFVPVFRDKGLECTAWILTGGGRCRLQPGMWACVTLPGAMMASWFSWHQLALQSAARPPNALSLLKCLTSHSRSAKWVHFSFSIYSGNEHYQATDTCQVLFYVLGYKILVGASHILLFNCWHDFGQVSKVTRVGKDKSDDWMEILM